MERPDKPTLQTRASAAAWLARLRSEKHTPEDEAAFREWLAADASHPVAFEMMNLVWDTARPPRGFGGKVPAPDRGINRRTLVGGVAAAGLGGGLFLIKAAQANVFQTEIGEQKRVLLRDGTQLFLDTNTKVVVDLGTKSRTVELKYGRANFRVGPPASRPLSVGAASNVIVGTGHSTFDVRRDGELVSIIMLQGRAAVETGQLGATPTRVLHSGERLISDRKFVKLDNPDLLPLLAWHTGHAIFRDETLIQAANEMNRYSKLHLEISEPQIQNLKISGMYRIGDNAEFARALEKLLPVRTRQFEDHIEIVSNGGRSPQI